ncbi:MAG: carbamoyltransferase HypF [Elusimicrobiota bacterium]|nr:carbamoyltransferase HypF [Elusimicrobiota bacterium]
MSRSRFLVTGTVQGVGFRPFVFRTAKKLELKGTVQNTGGGVIIEAEGPSLTIDNFKTQILNAGPPASQVNDLEELETTGDNFTEFTILKSSGSPVSTLNIPPDIALCEECRQDINNPGARRRDYPFTTCLNCGPRFSILKKLPYDRESVTMDSFEMCPACRKEYGNIDNRRYHAQPIACPECGPRYTFRDKTGTEALKSAAAYLKAGGVLALKGWGGYHIMGDAANRGTIEKIREIKKRINKPLAVMGSDPASIKDYCRITPRQEEVLTSFRRPIVLLEKNGKAPTAQLLAPLNSSIGFMLPYSPVHELLFKYSSLKVVVATSLNRPGEPTLVSNADAAEFEDLPRLEHNLKINLRIDDSVIKVFPEEDIFLRRSRGYVPRRIPLPGKISCLTSGAGQNSSFCFARRGKAMPSQYGGNLSELKAVETYRDMILKFRNIWNFNPELLGCDLHPGYGSSVLFKELANEWGLELKKVQHHHAHLAGCAAENNIEGEFMGVAFDGVGYGPGGEIMGGEFMKFSYSGYTREGFLKPASQPGGDMAAREPWRMALGYMKRAGVDIKEDFFPVDKLSLDAVERMIEKEVNSPLTTSAGRLFDAASAMAGLVTENTYIARAPIALESMVRKKYLNKGYDFSIIEEGNSFIVDTDNIIRGLAADIDKNDELTQIASKFHYTMALVVARGIKEMQKRTGLERACLSGGVFCNSYLAPLVKEMLKESSIKVYTHRLVSPNDNGISYGQAAVLSVRNLKGEK